MFSCIKYESACEPFAKIKISAVKSQIGTWFTKMSPTDMPGQLETILILYSNRMLIYYMMIMLILYFLASFSLLYFFFLLLVWFIVIRLKCHSINQNQVTIIVSKVFRLKWKGYFSRLWCDDDDGWIWLIS